MQYKAIFKKYKGDVLDILVEPETVKLGVMGQSEAAKYMKDRHSCTHGALCSCMHKIGHEAIEFLTYHGDFSICYLYFSV